MNLTNHLGRGIVAAAVASTVIGGAAGMAQADIASRMTPGAASAATATAAAANAPISDGALLAAASAPTAPRSPTATPGNARVKLTWLRPASNGGTPIDKYRVQRARAGAQWKTIADPTTRHYTATGLTNGTAYYFRVVAHNAAGWGSFSAAVKAVPRTVPSAPRSPTATAANATVKLSWLRPSSNGGAAIDKYVVQRSTNGTTWANIASPTGLSHPATGLVNGTKYYFRVRAHNTAGFGAFSAVVTVVPRTVSTAPQSVAATPGNESVHLSWSAPSSYGGAVVDKYRIEMLYNGSWEKVADTTVSFYTASALFNGVKESFRIRAHNVVGWSAPSAVVSAVPRTVPSIVPFCNAYQQVNGQLDIYVKWQPPASNGGAPIDHYTIELWKNGAYYISYEKEPYQVDAMAQVYSFGVYEVRVSAHNAAGNGAYCSQSAGVFP